MYSSTVVLTFCTIPHHLCPAGMEEMDNTDDEDEFGSEGVTGRGGGSSSSIQTVSFMIAQGSVQAVKRSAKEDSQYPLMEEYDFKNDLANPVLGIDLRASTRIRPYQEKSLSQMFGNGRARSGIIVLPCGAGKSLTGASNVIPTIAPSILHAIQLIIDSSNDHDDDVMMIVMIIIIIIIMINCISGVTAASTIKRATIIMCINNASVNQWKEQLITWTNIQPSLIKLFTSSFKDDLPAATEACVVISTYSMVCHGGKRSSRGEMMIQAVSNREWGLMILDEASVFAVD